MAASTKCLAALISLLLLAPAVAGEEARAASAEDEGALAVGDECADSADGEGTCALNALQRRGAAQRVEVDTKDGSADAQASEASAAAEGGAQAAENSTWVSCSYMGCGGYRRGWPCQCNSGCMSHGNCCWDYALTCGRPAPAPMPIPMPGWGFSPGGMMTLYHQTSPGACKSIMASSFRIGAGGWCGRGIYFAVSPQDTRTKAIAKSSGAGCMLEVKVNVGRVKRFPCCKHCHGYSEQSLQREGYDSVQFNPGDGDEYIIYNPNRVVSMREIPFNRAWMAHPR